MRQLEIRLYSHTLSTLGIIRTATASGSEALIKAAVNTAIWSPSLSFYFYLFVFPRCRDAHGDRRGSQGVQGLVTAERTCRPRTIAFWKNHLHVASCLTRGLLCTLSTLWFSCRLHCTPSWLWRLMQSLLSPLTSRITASPAQLIAFFFLFHKAHCALCLSLLHPWPSWLLMTQEATVDPCYDLSDSISDLVLMPHVSRGGRGTRRKKTSGLIHSAWFIFLLACSVFAITGCCASFMFFLCIIVPDVATCDAGSQNSCHDYKIH